MLGDLQGEKGIPWCKPTDEEHATERAIAKEVTRYRTEHAVEDAAKGGLGGGWDPSYLILAGVFGGAWQWRKRQAVARRAEAEAKAAEARLNAVIAAADSPRKLPL